MALIGGLEAATSDSDLVGVGGKTERRRGDDDSMATAFIGGQGWWGRVRPTPCYAPDRRGHDGMHGAAGRGCGVSLPVGLATRY
jgi:hypothetical protein